MLLPSPAGEGNHVEPASLPRARHSAEEKEEKISLLLTALVPVAFVVLLGLYAGRKGLVSEDGARNFSAYIVDFSLPCTLFVGVFSFTPAQFTNIPYLLTVTLALVVPFVVGLGIAMFGYRKSAPESGLFACNCGFPDMAYFGLPVLMTVVGTQGLLPVIVGNLVTSILIVPCIVLLLNHRASGAAGAPSLLRSLMSTAKQPVVWAPVLGLVLMLLGFELPSLATDSLKLVGSTTGGAALFTLGVLLSFLKNLFMPAMALGLALLFNLSGPLAQGAIIAAACPAATLGAMFSAKFQVAQKTAPAEILASNVLGIGTMAFWIFVAEKVV